MRLLSAAVRPDRQRSDRRARWRAEREVRRSRAGLHALRHVLHDQVPLRAAARMGARLSAPDAAPSRGAGAQERHRLRREPACGHRHVGPARHVRRRALQLGDRRAQCPGTQDAREGRGHSSRRAPAAAGQRNLRATRPARGHRAQHRRARLRQAQGRALRHLLRELPRHRHRRRHARGPVEERRRDRSAASRLLRHAQARAGRHRSRRGGGQKGLRRTAAVGGEGLR